MRPFQYKMVGYLMTEPFHNNEVYKHYYGKWSGWLPTLLLRVYYPNKKARYTKTPEECVTIKRKTRIFPFVIEPDYINELQAMGKMRGRLVCVTFYIDTVESGKTIQVQLHVTRVEDIAADFPQVFVDKQQIFIDANEIEGEFNYDEVQRLSSS